MILFTSTVLLSSLSLVLAAPAFSDPGYNCRPGQQCWPTSKQWRQLNQTLDGHLFETIPYGAPCYRNSPDYNPTTCTAVENNYTDGTPRGDTYGQTYWANWEACGDTGCSLLSSDPAETLYSTCSLGRLATYYIDVRSASHISATLKFAHTHNIRISIKNTGHDFSGRSAVPNSLAIWTHNLKSLDFYPSFSAYNCPSANGQNIGEMGAGVIAGDAYRYFGSHGMDITGGYEESVGIAGGFGLGGGVGDFTTTHGLMSDNAVEFEVVTADGHIRTINECNDSDLFWAMRGGGGGTFGVLTKYRVQVYPSTPIHTYNIVSSFLGNETSQQTALRTIMTAHAEHQLAWSSELITGQGDYFPTGLSMDLVLVYNDNGTKLRTATSDFANFITTIPDLNITQNNYTSYATYVDYLSYSIADAKATEPAGLFSQLSSRLIPSSIFTTPQNIDRLTNGIITGLSTISTHLNRTAAQIVLETPLSNPNSLHQTSAHPAWRDAIWHVIQVGEWDSLLPSSLEEEITKQFLDSVEPLKKLTPGGGAYANEAHYLEPEWESTFWGANYERLLSVKGKWDPTHLFDCWRCVGWRGDNDPFYSCYSK